MQSSIDVRNVGLKFRLNKERSDTLFETIRKFMRGVRPELEEFWALKDISFSINPGDRLAILGSNGAGKSTLLKVIAGVLKPTEGSIRCEGRIAPLLELGAGFNLQYTARENIYLYYPIHDINSFPLSQREKMHISPLQLSSRYSHNQFVNAYMSFLK